jgi:hypothetical protein
LRELVAQQLDASTRELHERLGADCSLSAGAIVAIVLGALLVAGGLGAYVVLLIRRSLRP